jgi:pimeloyl-ACP methyl ester carboxylesterase
MLAQPLAINSTNVRNYNPIAAALRLAWQRLDLAIASALAPDKAVETAVRLFSTPPRHGHTAPELALLASGERFDVRIGFDTLAAWRFGSAQQPTVILSHGWGGRGAQLRGFVKPLVEAGYQVVLFDHVAHGKSAGAEATLVHFIQGLDAVVGHVEATGARVAGVVGHSLGAAAAGAWLNATGRALRAVLVAPPTSVERYSGFFARRLRLREPVRRAMQERIERRSGQRWSQFELPHSVANVKAQALIVHDVDDHDVAFASGLALARAWPDARLVRTSGLGHRAVLRDDSVIRDAVEFLGDRVVFPPPPARGEKSAFSAPSPLV